MYSLLPVIIADVSPYYAYQNSDGMGRAIVILLFIGSIITWTIMIDKGYSLFKAKRNSELFIDKFRADKSIVAFIREADMCRGPLAEVYEHGTEKLIEYNKFTPEELVASPHQNMRKVKLSEAQLEAVRAVLEREVSNQVMKLEERIGLLATAVSVSPFFGLFGTVWGVMMAFCGLAAQGKADIAALAPGVSGALLTTVVGMMVAIPSLIGYNLLTITIRKITVYMDNFVEEFIARVKLEQLED
ncbi:MAG: MotA/TolQ/ExbB proton channel family protein [Victivallales bacterium]|nr:MotA/TolQ/ExbB proton channel family protein [Victivallales bacterium]